jgi:hypothetical protein
LERLIRCPVFFRLFGDKEEEFRESQNEPTEGKRNGIQWTMWQQLDDLDFADDIALISSTQQQMQEKTSLLAETSIKLGLRQHGLCCSPCFCPIQEHIFYT